jgi:hypothetical protein
MDEDSMEESAAGSADNSSRDADGDFNLSPVETRRYADNSDSEDEPVRAPGKSKYIARVKSAAAMNPELYGLRRSVSALMTWRSLGTDRVFCEGSSWLSKGRQGPSLCLHLG